MEIVREFSRYVQRLERPEPEPERRNPFLPRESQLQGLLPEGIARLHELCSFAPMGAAEYESSRQQHALFTLTEMGTDLVAQRLRLRHSLVPYGRWEEKESPYPEGVRPELFLIVPPELEAYAHAFITAEMRNVSWKRPRIKAGSFMRETLLGHSHWQKTGGWLALETPFFVFADPKMFEGFRDFFGLGGREPSIAVLNNAKAPSRPKAEGQPVVQPVEQCG